VRYWLAVAALDLVAGAAVVLYGIHRHVPAVAIVLVTLGALLIAWLLALTLDRAK